MTLKAFERGGRLPVLRLRTPAGEPLALRGGRGPIVLLGLAPDRCAGWSDYVAALGRRADEFAGWGARVVAITEGSRAHDALAVAAAARVVLASDPEGDFVAPSGPAARLLIADEWGEIHFAANGVAVADLPAAAEIVDWVRFIAIQCPECEQPEGEWRAV